MAIATITQLVKPNSIDYEASMLSVHTFMDNNSNIRISLAHYWLQHSNQYNHATITQRYPICLSANSAKIKGNGMEAS